MAASLTVIWLALKIALTFFIHSQQSDADLGGVAAFKLGYNLMMLAEPWQWPMLFAPLVPVALSIYFAVKQPSRAALNWVMTYLLCFFIFFIVANITEHRAFGDLTGFGAMSIIFLLIERKVVARQPTDDARL